MTLVRINKWISEKGFGSRREAEKWIQEKRIKINDRLAIQGDKVNSSTDKVRIDGKVISDKSPPKVYWLLNKPDKTLTSKAREDGKERIFDLPKLKDLRFHVFPVGRLDFRTEGLLLLTNDGELCHQLTHPKYKVPRHYMVLINGKLDASQIRNLKSGVPLEDGIAKCTISQPQGVNLGKSKGSWYFVTVSEGRNRLVRRIFEHYNHKVVRLVRYGFGNLRLENSLKPGDYRQLNSQEIRSLKFRQEHSKKKKFK